jgi:hypothetical protein
MTYRRTDIEEFLSLLISPYMAEAEEEGCIAFSSILKREEKKSRIRTFKVSTHQFWEEAQAEEQEPSWLSSLHQENAEGANIYFGYAIRSYDFLHQRGSSRGGLKDCIASTAFVIDFDLKNDVAHKATNLPPSIEDLEPILDGRPDPSIVLHSGYGIHAYWLYRSPVWIQKQGVHHKSSKHYNKRREALQGLYRKRMEAQGWQLDTTYSTDRIWRLPNFTNYKLLGEDGVAEDYEHPRVEVLYGLDGDPIFYDVEEIYQGVDNGKASTAKTKPLRPKTVPAYERPEGEFDRSPMSEALEARGLRHQDLIVDKSLTEGMAGLPELIATKAKHYHDNSQEFVDATDAADAAKKSAYLTRLILGESLEEKGNRDHALTRVCGLISFLTPDIVEFSEEDLDLIVTRIMGPSLQCWVDDTEDTDLEREMEKTIEKLVRIKEKDQENKEAPFERMREAFKRRHPFLQAAKEEGLLGDDSAPELTRDELLQRGLLVYKNYVYVWDVMCGLQKTAIAHSGISFLTERECRICQ